MRFLVCVVPVCPVRAEPFHKSEQVSQLLFGEACEVLETVHDFTRIRSVYDYYEGWCQSSQLTVIDEVNIDESALLTTDWVSEITLNHTPLHVPFGSTLHLFGNTENTRFSIKFNGNTTREGEYLPEEKLIKKFALLYLNTPYLWGGRSVFGVDCSGFCQTVFRMFGVRLQRDAYQQATQGEMVGFLQEARCGDLAFFDNSEGRITHVGIMVDQNSIIHASGKVRIDTIDHTGIINSDTGARTHKLRILRRYF
jgi:hypothetical protein